MFRRHGVEQGLAVRHLQLVEPPAAQILLWPVSGEELGEHEVAEAAEVGPVNAVVAGYCFACKGRTTDPAAAVAAPIDEIGLGVDLAAMRGCEQDQGAQEESA